MTMTMTMTMTMMIDDDDDDDDDDDAFGIDLLLSTGKQFIVPRLQMPSM